MVREAAGQVADPVASTVSIHEMWKLRTGVSGGKNVVIGPLGGGSDYVPFFSHLGIPSSGHGFGGAAGVYHSAYDTNAYMERFGDPGYRQHVAAAAVTAALAWRLADADLLPFDYVGYAAELRLHSERAERALQSLGWDARGVDATELNASVESFAAAARAQQEAARAFLESTPSGHHLLARINTHIRAVERRMTRPTGLVGRPWFRNLVFAPDRDDDYGTMPLPGVGEAVRDRDLERARLELASLAAAIDSAAVELESAVHLLTDRTLRRRGVDTP